MTSATFTFLKGTSVSSLKALNISTVYPLAYPLLAISIIYHLHHICMRFWRGPFRGRGVKICRDIFFDIFGKSRSGTENKPGGSIHHGLWRPAGCYLLWAGDDA